MKPLHTSSQVTASDSLMVVRVMEISTPDGPVRRIVVEANAEMDTTEARWLRDKLDLAITLAESTEPVEGDRITRFLDAWRQEKERFEPAVSEDQPAAHVWHKNERGELYSRTNNTWRSGTVIVAGSVTVPLEFQFDDNGSVARLYDVSVLRPLSVPAVSEDQPKPRVFPKGSPEPEGVEAVTDEAGFRWNRAGRVNDRQHHWRRVDLGVMGSFVLWTRLNRRPLSEVLADSEQVTR